MSDVTVSFGQDDVLLNNHKQCVWKPVEDIKDPYVEEIGRFAVIKCTHDLTETDWTFIRVVSSESLAVEEGKLYRVVMEVKKERVTLSPQSSTELYVANVLDHKKPIKSWTVLSFESSALPTGHEFWLGPI